MVRKLLNNKYPMIPNPQSPKPVALVKPVACLVRQKDASNFEVENVARWRFFDFCRLSATEKVEGVGVTVNARGS